MEFTGFYDVIIINDTISSLIAGASLARKGFRVLLISQEPSSLYYKLEGLTLPKYPMTFYGINSSIVQRVINELGLTQIIKTKLKPLDILLQIILPDRRLDITKDFSIFEKEIGREFPELKRDIKEFYERLGDVYVTLNKFLVNAGIFPPYSFLGKKSFSLLSLHDPIKGGFSSFLGHISQNHPYLNAILKKIEILTSLDATNIDIRRFVLVHYGWIDGVYSFYGDIESFSNILKERFEVFSGTTKYGWIEKLIFKRNKIIGVKLKGSEEIFGCKFIIFGGSINQLLPLLEQEHKEQILKKLNSKLKLKGYKYSMNLVVESKVVPEHLMKHVIYLPNKEDVLFITVLSPEEYSEIKIVNVVTIIPPEKTQSLDEFYSVRNRMLEYLKTIFPFLEKYILKCSSPWDEYFGIKEKNNIELGSVKGDLSYLMIPIYTNVDNLTWGIGAMDYFPVFKNLILIGSEVIPGLGFEANFITGWSASSIIKKSDKINKKLRKDFWSKLHG